MSSLLPSRGHRLLSPVAWTRLIHSLRSLWPGVDSLRRRKAEKASSKVTCELLERLHKQSHGSKSEERRQTLSHQRPAKTVGDSEALRSWYFGAGESAPRMLTSRQTCPIARLL